MGFEEVDWDEVREKLPYEKNDKQKKQRSKMFKSFDMQGNGILSLAEVTKGIRDELKMDDVLVKAPVDAAFHKAKSINKDSKKKSADDYIDRKEFRQFLYYLRQYFEYYVAFEELDKSGDHMIEPVEFGLGLKKLEKWVGDVGNPVAAFHEIDIDNGGKIRFREFCVWAFDKGLDLSDDDDSDSDDK